MLLVAVGFLVLAIGAATAFQASTRTHGQLAVGPAQRGSAASVFALAAQFGQDLAVPLAFGDEGLRIISMAHEDEQGDIVRPSVALLGEFGQQAFIVARIGFRFARIACRMHARLATQSRNADS